ncbi:MAG: MOSC domain-containing protein [Methylococcaceae bacterium]|nr:MOSC domain-containing protein [Methylococcaceae bacterium]
MPQIILSDIFIYPVKSLAGIKVSQWTVNEKGLLYDRKWMLIDSNNQFLSQRRLPKMTLIKTEIKNDTLILSTTVSGSISLPLTPENGDDINTTIWKDQCLAKTTTPVADKWLSDFLEMDCKLVYQPDNIIRPVDPDYAADTDKVNFSDGFPFLIVSDASLTSLNQEMKIPLPMLRFRPNLVISNCKSYAEDSWKKIQISNIVFRLPKACSRCSVPTIDTETAQTNKEPLTTLSRLRRWNNKVFFGQNALHDTVGELSVGDPVEIIKTGLKQPPI